MLLAVEIGNSQITFGIYEGCSLSYAAHVVTDHRLTADQYAISLHQILDLYHVNRALLSGSIICSVVPELTAPIAEAIHKLLGIQPLILGPGVRTGLNIRIDNPAQLGSDLVADAVAAIAQFPMPCLIFDLGTATSISVLNQTGTLLGVSICAGVGMMQEGLCSRTALLPHIDLTMPDSPIGRNTVQAMQSGLLYGAAAMIDGMADRLTETLGAPATLLATGCYAQKVLPACKRAFLFCDHLLLDGLRIIYEKNKK
ncbi:type III pantothenate kinase [Yeguia hominis]|uniref:Type III pantothenate kinase n=1 Tax=Yeguia hominis TaxID=2763662 RepID=A0A926D7S6_9FIRM|nr:type III pantothenate kinase [Yeguia hominis]MBC8532972.1 type III pantothenate kinase [Yeguia hominis]